MPWSNGVFTPLWSWVVDSVSFPDILASRFDTYEDDQATGINTCLAKDGQNAPTANLPMGGFKHTNIAVSAARNQYPATSQVQDSSFITAADTGAADAYVMTLTPTITAYTTGMIVWIRPTNTNTTASTININSLGVKNIKVGSTDLFAAPMVSGQTYALQYDGTSFQLLGSSAIGANQITYAMLAAAVQQALPGAGDFLWSFNTSKSGWVLSWGSIGSATSGATNRANADTSALYTVLWNSLADAQAPVSGGRGATPAADFAANKTLSLPDLRGRGILGQDDMGGTSANRITVAGCGMDGDILGNSGGSEFTQQHTHIANITDPGHGHLQQNSPAGGSFPAVNLLSSNVNSPVATGITTATTGITVTNDNYGTGTSGNVQPSLIMNGFYKL